MKVSKELREQYMKEKNRLIPTWFSFEKELNKRGISLVDIILADVDFDKLENEIKYANI